MKPYLVLTAWLKSRLLGLGLLLSAITFQNYGQTTTSGDPCDGEYAFVIVDAETGEVIARGMTTSRGTIEQGVVLGANRTYGMTVARGDGKIGSTSFRTGDNGSTTDLPKIKVGDTVARDSDGDGVTDDIENVFGTNPRSRSTVPGISDKALIMAPRTPGANGLSIANNPAFGPRGIIGSVALSGICVDISTFNNMAALACLANGVTVFNIFNGLAPRIIAVVDTPGEARAVAIPDLDLAVADGPAGLVVIDLRDPASAKIRMQTRLGSYAESVASLGGTAYVGLRSGQLCVVDMASGAEIQRLNLGAEVFDVIVGGDFLFAVSGNILRAFSFKDGLLSQVGSVALAGIGPDPLSGRKRVFAGGGWVLVSCMSGFDIVDTRVPSAMVVTGKAGSGPGSFKQIISDGSGLGLAPVGTNPRADGTHDISLYSLANAQRTTDLLTTLATPGTAYANAIFNGFDYVADGEKGLQVLRYRDTDFKGIPPVVTLNSGAQSVAAPQVGAIRSTAVNLRAEEGKLLRISADASDDVQVRNVEMYIDGQLIGSDGNFPFDFYFFTPLRTPAKDSVTARARAFDMGGNATWSAPLTIQLGPDTSPPIVSRTLPIANTILGSLNSVIAFFSEPLRADSVRPDAFVITGAGPDGIVGTADDRPAPSGTLTYQDSLRAAVWTFDSPLAAGLWHAVIRPSIADRGGNLMERPYRFNFILFDQPDRDHDGVPDALEAALGLDPDNPDSRGDGTRDGDRDFDNDGLSNAAEIVLGTDPRKRDTDGNGTLDGAEDTDKDGLPDGKEVLYGTSPLVADSDGDGWNDESEVTAGSDPIDPTSKPKLFVIANPVAHVIVPNFAPGAGGPHLFVVSQPPVAIGLPNFESLELQLNTVVAQPPVKIGLPNFSSGAVSLNTIVGLPPVKINVNKQ